MLSVVMPAHNEAGYLETAVQDVDDGLRARSLEHEILVVENGSIDDTLDIGQRLADELPAVRVSTRAVADYGAALRDGILAARGDIIVTFDVDYYDLGFVDDALALLTGDAPPAIVVGSKRAPGARRRAAMAAAARHDGVQRAPARGVLVVGLGYARHEGDAARSMWSRSSSAVASVPTYTTPSW